MSCTEKAGGGGGGGEGSLHLGCRVLKCLTGGELDVPVPCLDAPWLPLPCQSSSVSGGLACAKNSKRHSLLS